MASILTIAEVASLIGDPARANMLYVLKDSDTATAGDLTRAANVAPSTASEHLAKMTEAGLIAVSREGRKRYFRLTSDHVSDVLDGLEAVGARTRPDGPPDLRDDEAALHARSCGDHLSGRVGVALAETLLSRGWLAHWDGRLALTDPGRVALAPLLPDLPAIESGPRKLAVLCHDWSENAFHLGGALGGALLKAFETRDWVRRPRGAQVVRITPRGKGAFRREFGLDAQTV